MELLPHQKRGVDILLSGGENSVLIADEPRVGKTLTAIELERSWRRKTKRRLDKTLIVAGNDQLSVWTKGLQDRGIRAETYIVVDKPKRIQFASAVAENRFDYYIINYDAVPKVKELLSGTWLCIIVDEAHNIKGRDTKRTKALKRIKSEYKIATTGTPADNKIEDFWSVLNWLWKKDFPSYWKFISKFTKHWKNEKVGYTVVTGVNTEALPEFWNLLHPGRYLRRTLDEVSGGMPPILYQRIDIEMGAQQFKRYRDYEQTNLTELESLSDPNINVDVLSSYTVKTFQHLQILATGDCKVEEYEKWKKDDEYDDGGYYYDAHRLYIKNSPKVDWIIEYVKEHSEPVVILCQFNDAANFIYKAMIQHNISSVLHNGLRTREGRDDAKNLFMNDVARVLVGTFGVTREGIDLSRADTIIMVDRPWRTKWNEQAENRIRNLFKKNPVQVIDLTAVRPDGEKSIDEYRMDSLENKNENIKLMTERPND